MRQKTNRYAGNFNQEEIAWLRLSPARRMQESAKLWKFYFAMRGKLDGQPDPQGPFDFKKA